MPPRILEHWNIEHAENSHGIVVPDGCRDLIFLTHTDGRQQVMVTGLDVRAYRVASNAGDRYDGFRFRPECIIDDDRLLRYLMASRVTPDSPALRSIIHDTVQVDAPLAEALQALRVSGNLTQAGQGLGVSVRTLERLMKNRTGESPLFWLRLLRMRRTAGMLFTAQDFSLPDIALDGGYCDQSHMNREFQRWLGVTPAAVRINTRWQRAFGEGYD